MQQKINIEQAHNEIGQALHDAKRRLLDAHSKGVPLNVAGQTFLAEAENILTRAEIKTYGELFAANAAQPAAPKCAQPILRPTSDAPQVTVTEREDYSLQEERLHVIIEDAIFVDGTSTARIQQRALIRLLDTLERTPKEDLANLLISARDFAIKNSPELTDEIAARVCGREIEKSPDVSATETPQRKTFDPDLAGEERPYDASPEAVAEFMAANPQWENRLLRARASFRDPIDKLKNARDGAIEAASTIDKLITEGMEALNSTVGGAS